jgi:epoxyqueuosine reductase
MYEKIKSLAESLQIDYTGAASLASAREFILRFGGERAAKYPYCLSLGIALPNAIVDALPEREEYAVRLDYRTHAYEFINRRLDEAASRIASLIQQSGYSALPVPAAERINGNGLYAFFSHKLGAHLAGHGWIGKSCLLVTKEHGPRVRFVSVLTDAPLKPTGEPMEQQCGECTECVDICPVHAFTGRNFSEDEPREKRYDAHKCEDYYDAMEAEGKLKVCGMCLYVCPYGRKFKEA